MNTIYLSTPLKGKLKHVKTHRKYHVRAKIIICRFPKQTRQQDCMLQNIVHVKTNFSNKFHQISKS